MRIALYFEGEKAQVILTANDGAEKSILDLMLAKNYDIHAMQGSFYDDPHGGYVRESKYAKSSLILKFTERS